MEKSIIAKFGGTSVSTAARIRTLCGIVKKTLHKRPVIVVSALAGVTNLLLSLPKATELHQKRGIREIRKMHKILIEDLFTSEKTRDEPLSYIEKQLFLLENILGNSMIGSEELDHIASFGEIMSSRIVVAALEESGIAARGVLATDVIITNNNFGSAEFLPKPTEARIKKVLTPLLTKAVVPVVTGFIGSTKDGRVTTLGRGGSDYTASIIGFCLKASEIQIWTDVDGIFTADPRIVKEARLIKTISFKEASELATFGARVLHPRTIKPAIKAGIPVRVLNSFNPNGEGTLIVEKPNLKNPARSVCAKRDIVLVNIYSEEMLLQKGFLAKVFFLFAKHDISIDLVTVSEVSISITLDNSNKLDDVVAELKKFSMVSIKKGVGIVSVIGEGISQSSETITEIFTSFREKIPIRMVSLGAIDINISFVVDDEHVEKAVQILHNITVR